MCPPQAYKFFMLLFKAANPLSLVRIVREIIVRLFVSIQTITVILHGKRTTALWTHEVRVSETLPGCVRAMKEVFVVQAAVGREWEIAAIFDVEYVDAIVLFWFAAADKQGVGIVAHIGLGNGSGGGEEEERIGSVFVKLTSLGE